MGDVRTEAVITAAGAVGTASPAAEQLYELKITAVGEVRDADGNLLSSEPYEATAVLTEDQIKAQLEGTP